MADVMQDDLPLIRHPALANSKSGIGSLTSMEHVPLIVEPQRSNTESEEKSEQKMDRLRELEEAMTVTLPLPRKLNVSNSKASLVSSASAALCRICHAEGSPSHNPLIAPCRCAGSLQFVHRSCLVHWLELSTRKMIPAPQCELCGYIYKRSHWLMLRSIHLPRLEVHDMLLNLLFLLASSIMVGCAFLSVHFLRMSEMRHGPLRPYRYPSQKLAEEDMLVVVCSAFFFAAFFTAVFTQYRADASIFRIFFRFVVINRNWTIKNYSLSDDPEMQTERSLRQDRVQIDSTMKYLREATNDTKPKTEPSSRDQNLVIVVDNR